MFTVLTLCLVLIVGKRRHELGVSGSGHRPALVGYSAHFLDLVLVLCSGLTVVGYLLFLRTESGYAAGALLTAPCALLALFRYLQIVVVQSEGGNPVRTLLRDGVMLTNSSLWAGPAAGLPAALTRHQAAAAGSRSANPEPRTPNSERGPMPTPPPLVSVVVPMYNDSRTVDLCLRSILEQSYPAVEVIVVDDASTDDSADLAAAHPVTLVRAERNGGPGGSRNLGVRHAAA